ncbi:hypothetical protein [Streptomyces sp. ODS28]|uniref:hypothetical protein n=1 Tax=Streptomyces sp. ODS28 TaxID=3136688 RepID=UPI0031E9E169
MPNTNRNWPRFLRERAAAMRGSAGERGVSALEYVGMVIIVAAIILAIKQLNLGPMIAGAVSGAVQKVIGGG